MFGQDGWIQTKFSFALNDRDEVLVNENAKIERGEYAAIFFEQAWSIKDLLYGQKDNFFLRGQRGKSRAGLPRSQSERRIRFIFPLADSAL